MDITTLDNNRRNLTIVKNRVEEVLPSYFAEQYPRFSALLRGYYEYNDGDGSPSALIHQLFQTRDITQVDESLLRFIEDELLLGQSYFQGFDDKRAAAKYSSVLYRSKGSKYSIQQFFRTFFGLDPEVVYTKQNVFIVGESQCGAESQRFITNDKLYQTFAILIRIGIPISQWLDVYKLFVHPAGMYIGGEVQVVEVARMFPAINDDIMPDALTDDDAGLRVIENVATMFSNPVVFSDVTGIIPTDSAGYFRISLNETVAKFGPETIEKVDTQYVDIADLMQANSPTFDEDSGGPDSANIGFSNTFETMDQNLIGLYDSA